MEQVLDLSRGEADVRFGRDEVFVEKLVVNARHIELQIMGDGRGNCVHLGSRDCSVQRRYQKIVEEAPAPSVDPEALQELIGRCLDAMEKIRYRNAATLEFLYSAGQFYFLEVNTRLQVEHPVTESVTGQDVVAAQLAISDQGSLPFNQSEIAVTGHAIECRLLAEDEDGLPSPGRVTRLEFPGGPGIRIDSHLYVGYEVPHQYDSMVAKVIAHGTDRSAALARMAQALTELRIEGIKTNIINLKMIIHHPDFAAVDIHTNWKPE